MKEKSEVFGILKKLNTFVEKQSGKYIKALISDRGKEYNSHDFDKLCEDECIERQNGVSERKNQTIMEMGRLMIKHKGLPNKFWAEAVYTAVYILNRCLTKEVNEKTQSQAWCGKKPSAKHLRVFGSICYIHVLSQKKHKLDENSICGIFLGYNTQSKGYKVYNLQTKKLIVNRDVEVDVNASWNRNEG